MTEPTARPPVAPSSCPLLGLPGDPRTHYSFAHDGHRCHARARPAPIDPSHQSSYCLTAQFGRCSLYRTREAGRPGGDDAIAAGAGVLAVAVGTEPVGRWATGPRVQEGRSRRRAAVGGAVVLGLLAVGATLLRPPERPAGLPAKGVTSTATNRPGAAVEASEVASSTPTRVPDEPSSARPSLPPVTPSPGSPAPVPPPTAQSGPAPTATPRLHVVRAGDWLSTIAATYGTTVERLVALNDIADPDVIEVGDRIVLPPEPP